MNDLTKIKLGLIEEAKLLHLYQFEWIDISDNDDSYQSLMTKGLVETTEPNVMLDKPLRPGMVRIKVSGTGGAWILLKAIRESKDPIVASSPKDALLQLMKIACKRIPVGTKDREDAEALAAIILKVL